MNIDAANAIINEAEAEGVEFILSAYDTVQVEGVESVVERWLPVLRANKVDIVRVLRELRVWSAAEVDEAAEERAAIMGEAGTDTATAERLAELAREFYNHLFGEAKWTGCCHAPVGRYCTAGERLRDAYYRVASDMEVVPREVGFERLFRRPP